MECKLKFLEAKLEANQTKLEAKLEANQTKVEENMKSIEGLLVALTSRIGVGSDTS